MRVGMISDIHDNIWALDGALQALAPCDVLLCLGDICSPFTMVAIGEAFAGPIHVVWGNNDGDRAQIMRASAEHTQITFHGEFAELDLAGCRVAMTHWPEIAKALVRSGDYDVVCHGHNHRRHLEQVGSAWLVNPGEVMGRFGVRSVAILDTETLQTELVLVS